MQRTQSAPSPRLARLNPTVVFLVALGVMLAALFAPGIAGEVLLLAIVVGLAALMARTWPVQSPGMRTVRVVVISLLVAGAVAKLL